MIYIFVALSIWREFHKRMSCPWSKSHDFKVKINVDFMEFLVWRYMYLSQTRYGEGYIGTALSLFKLRLRATLVSRVPTRVYRINSPSLSCSSVAWFIPCLGKIPWPLIGWDIFWLLLWNHLDGIRRNLTGRKILTSSTKFVFFGPIGQTRWLPLPLFGWDIFDFSSESAERNSTKLDRKQDLNVLY